MTDAEITAITAKLEAQEPDDTEVDPVAQPAKKTLAARLKIN